MNNNNLPDYKELFGALDFKKGDDARSVYSPAAYLADLLQIMDDEFIPTDVNKIDARRRDIRKILLDSENTYTLIPYLGIVNEVLEHKIENNAGKPVYNDLLLNATYPFNQPFNLSEEELRLYLKYLGISAEALHKLFAVDKEGLIAINEDNTILACEYLNLSPEDHYMVGKNYSTNSEIEACYNYSGANFAKDMAVVSTFLEKTGITGQELRELLYQNLREEEYGLQSGYFINTSASVTYAIFDDAEEYMVQSDGSTELSYKWFDRVNRFIRLSKKIGIGFTDLDLILRNTLKTELDDEALRLIAVTKKLHETLELPIDVVVSLIRRMNEHGHTEENYPQDLFNRVYNNKCAKLDKQYIKGSGTVPKQYLNNGYREILYADDLFSEANYDFRRRLMQTLGISKTDLETIIQRLDDQKVDEALWMENERKVDLLNFLYRFTQLALVLDLSHDELFTLFELLEQDPSITRFNQQNTFINYLPYTQDCYAIFMGYDVENLQWLIQSLVALKDWMTAYDFTADMLWYIATGSFKNEKENTANMDLTISQLDGLYQAFKAVHFSAETFKPSFDKRSSRLIYWSLLQLRAGESEGAMKLVQENPEQASKVAHIAISQLSKITEHDFMDLGIEEPLVEKIFRNLMYRNYIDAKGLILSETLPNKVEDFQLETDFTPYLEQVFALIHKLYKDAELKAEADEEFVFSVYPSDLISLGFNDNEVEELYDNLTFNHYINEEGLVQFNAFFSYPDNAIHFDVNTHIGEHSEQIYSLMKKQQASFKEGRLILDSSVFDELQLKEVELEDLMENLRFNAYIDKKGQILDKSKLLKEDVGSFRLALQFYPNRHLILKALKDKVAMYQQEYLAVDRSLLAIEAEKIVSEWAYEDLKEEYLNEGYLLPKGRDFFLNKANRDKLILGYYFENATGRAIFDRMQQIIQHYETFQLTDQPLLDMKFYPEEISEMVDLLIEQKLLTTKRQIPVDKIDYFLESNNALNFNLEGFEDFKNDIFFILQAIAKRVATAYQNIQHSLSDLENKQEKLLFSQLQSMFGMDAESMKSISSAIFPAASDLKSAWLLPLFESADALDQISSEPGSKAYNIAISRIRQFSVLANKLQFNKPEIEIAFQEQNIVSKFPETLALPESVETIDALLEHNDFVYLFQGGKYWIYRQSDYKIVDKTDLAADNEMVDLQRKDDELREILKVDPIRLLFEKEGASLTVDAAFKDKIGNIYLISGNYYFLLLKGEDTWTKRVNEFGQVDNDFESLEEIDAAYKDDEGRLFLFANGQYIRYSGGFNFIDEGYPKNIDKDWANENIKADLSEIFKGSVDAAFEGTDKESYFFKDNKFVSSKDNVIKDIAKYWGKLKHDFKHINQIDAAFTDGGNTYFFVGNLVVMYTDCIENKGIRVAEGFPKTIIDCFPSLPHEFVNGVDATFKGEDGKIHLFKNEYAVSFFMSDTNITLQKLVDHWGKVKNNIQNSGIVDAALVGLDGKTYIFSGDQYFRYSGADYSKVDEGYPRLVKEDWKGLSSVNAAYVLNGKTYLFGPNGVSNNLYVRYSTPDYTHIDEKDENDQYYISPVGNLPDVKRMEVFPAKQDDNWWSLPKSLVDTGFKVDAVLNALNGKSYLFSGNMVVETDQMHRWWSEPKTLSEKWDKLAFPSIDAAFAGKDGKTYLFSGNKYVRFSDVELNKIDNGYPRKISDSWGKVENIILDNYKIDAALVVESREEKEDYQGNDIKEVNKHTYLFSGDQFFRYVNAASGYVNVEPGYPKSIQMLTEEPRFKELKAEEISGIDAAFADHRNVYLFKGKQCHVVSDKQDWVYDKDDFKQITEIFLEDGRVFAVDNNQWKRLSALEGDVIDKVDKSPNVLNTAPTSFKTGLDTILQGTDGNTYFFKGNDCYNALLKNTYPIGEEWGKTRNHIYEHEHIDAAFVGRDGKTYVFSGDQYYMYETKTYIGQKLEQPPKRIDENWMGLKTVAFAYVVDEETYLFEQPEIDGNFRYVIYTTDNYKLEKGKLKRGDMSFWNIPPAQKRAGFDRFSSIMCRGDNLIFIKGQHFIQYNLLGKKWSFPRKLDLLFPGIPFNKTTFKSIQAAFVGADDAVYFFDWSCYVELRNGTFSAESSVKDDWGLVHNYFENGVDSSLVHEGITYLFSGNRYLRYSSGDYRFVDEGYPKEIAKELRKEKPFMYMAKEFQYAIDKLEEPGTTVKLHAVITNERNTYAFIGNAMHVGSSEMVKILDISNLNRVMNNFETLGKVDATFVDKDNKTYLFSGNQYIRYSDSNYDYVDQGYPKFIIEDLAAELGATALPSDFQYGIDAAFTDDNGTVYLFRDEHFWNSFSKVDAPITSLWGKNKNAFTETTGDKSVDAAYMDPEDRLHVFKGDQFVRYSDIANLFSGNDGLLKYVDASFPMAIEDHPANLPASFAADLKGAFRFEDNIYFVKGNEHVKYVEGAHSYNESIYPLGFKYRWGNWSDYLIHDIYLLSRFMDLNTKFTSDDMTLSSLLHKGDGYAKEPYFALSEIFGFDKEEIRWLKEMNAFLSMTNTYERDFDLETVVRIYDVLSEAQRINVPASKLYTEVWLPLYEGTRNASLAAGAARKMLATLDCNDNYSTLFDQIDREMNTIKRDVLVPYAIANDDDVSDARDLYQKLLIDVQMENEASTSRIKEATMAIQLFFHRFFLNLEEMDLKGSNDEEVAASLKEQWEWMRNYRVWEANRKVFLYPENYIRPELRDTKTPPFETMEQDLLQGEITDDAVQRVYKKYLDEYTEVSRLKIAGGYMYDETDEDNPEKINKKLVLFGRTKSDPIRYYYRFGNFLGGKSEADTWEPWLSVNIPIDADRVYPVVAFNKVFVFWSKVETVSQDSKNATLVDEEKGSTHNISSGSNSAVYTVKIYYSYYNLNKEWIQPQLLQTVFEKEIEKTNLQKYVEDFWENTLEKNFPGIDVDIEDQVQMFDELQSPHEIIDVKLFVEYSKKLGNSEHDNILISCQYNQTLMKVPFWGKDTTTMDLKTKVPVQKAFALTPELYSKKANFVSFGNRGQETFVRLFDEGSIEEQNIVALNTSETSLDAPWFCYDHKGGSFLCKPNILAFNVDEWPKKLQDNTELPDKGVIDAAFHEDKTGVTYYFSGNQYFTSNNSTKKTIAARWGKVAPFAFNNITAAFQYNGATYIMDANQCTEYTDAAYAQIATGFPILNNFKLILSDLVPSGNWDAYDNDVVQSAFNDLDSIHFSVKKTNGVVTNHTLSLGGVLTNSNLTNLAAGFISFYNSANYRYRFEGTNVAILNYKTNRSISIGGSSTPDVGRTITATFSEETANGNVYLFSGTEYIVLTKNQSPTSLVNAIKAWANPQTISAKWLLKGTAGTTFDTSGIDAAYIDNKKLFLIRGKQYVRYTVANDGTIGEFVDANYPKDLNFPSPVPKVDIAFQLSEGSTLNNFLFCGDYFYKFQSGVELNTISWWPAWIKGNWGNIPIQFRIGSDAALNKDGKLYFFKGNDYISYITNDDKEPVPYEVYQANYEIVRLTTSTADQLNQLLFAGGVEALLQLSSQQIDEIPTFSSKQSSATSIKVRDTDKTKMPVSSHVDFNSANGMYYWEVFFHAPFLIAQALNTDQKFEEAKEWYEHIYNPTEALNYWKFLPFLAVDVEGLIEPAKKLVEALDSKLSANMRSSFAKTAEELSAFDDEFSGENQRDGIADEITAILESTNGRIEFSAIVDEVSVLCETEAGHKGLACQLLELLQLIQQLPGNFKAMLNTPEQINKYLKDPFDPHAIAGLRTIAYRKAIVMNYIDNLLDWGDMLYRRYSRESINEARMLYVLAYDLLGKKPENLGVKKLSEPKSFEELGHYHNQNTDDYDFLLQMENTLITDRYESLSFDGTVHDSIANSYFYIPENSLFMDYWNRVEDRLFKIRNSLNIMGEKQPLPLFQPPIDPMALVNAVAAGGSISAAMDAISITVPHYRFSYMLEKAKAYADKVAQFGGDLLGAIEKKDAEELEILHNKQEAAILQLNTQIKKDQIKDAEENIKNLTESQVSAKKQYDHYKRLKETGLIPEEETQIAMMLVAASIHGADALAKIVSGLSYVVPQVTAGPFSFGVTAGGQQVGKMLELFGESTSSIAEGLSMGGEVAGIYAQHKRSEEDWELQMMMSDSEVKQLDFQIKSAELQKAIAKRELQVHEKDIDNNESVARFMLDKFSNKQLYQWMSSKLSGLFYQSYKMAHDIARQAEKAFQYETGSPEQDVNFIAGTYWDSQKKGLLSGESLGVDLAKMEKAYMEQDHRGMEITRNISLLELDPLAFIKLKTKGECEFRLTEALFDYDFPGHYNRQMKSIALAFDIGEGQTVNATLTQLNNRLVMEPDIKAVKYLLEPKGGQPLTIRSDWKTNQQIALSYVDEYTENNGLFELRYDDERYLPFEGTGAVSLWHLELNGKKGSYNPNDLLDVTIKLRYTAEQGGSAFASAVRGVLKPYNATSFFDLAYSFPEEWNEFMQGTEKSMKLKFERSMFPNIVGSKLIGLFTRYEYNGDENVSLVLNDALKLENNKYIQVNNLNIAREGSEWKFTVQGDKTQIKNVEMVLVYKAKA